MQRKSFTLLELLIVLSIIVLLMSILLPCLMTAKERAFELFVMQVEVNKEGKTKNENQSAKLRKTPTHGFSVRCSKITRPA